MDNRIVSVDIVDGELIVTYQDGSTESLGPVAELDPEELSTAVLKNAGDIVDLKRAVSALQTSVTALDTAVGAAETSIDSLEAEVGAIKNELNERLSAETTQLYDVIEEDESIVNDILNGTDTIIKNNYFKFVQGGLAAGVLIPSTNTVTTEDYIDNSSENNYTLHYDATNFKINIVRYDSEKSYVGQTGFITTEPIRIRQYITDPFVKVSVRLLDNSDLLPAETKLYTIEEIENGIAYKDEIEIEQVTQISVNANGGADFTTIRGALESITNPSAKNRYIVNVYPGTYDLKQEYSDIWTDNSFIGCTVPAFTKLKGIGKSGSVILTATDTESSESHRLTMSTLNIKQSSELENLTITGAGLKYTIHDDYNSDKYLGFREIRDVIVTGDNPLTNAIWGAGAWQNTKTRFVNCVFSSNTKVALVYIHTNTSADYPSYFEFINCRFKSYNTSFGDCRLNLSSVSNAKNTPCYVTFYGTKVRTIYLTAEGGNTSLNWFISGFGNEVHGVETAISGAEPQADLIGTATYARYSDGAY